MRRSLLCLALVFFLLLTTSSIAFASCAATPSIGDEAKSSNLIFVGTVTKLTTAQLSSAGYPINGKKRKWEKYFFKTDVATFTVGEVFKGDVDEKIEVATSSDGEAGYKFDGGTWLKVGQTYLMYSRKRQLAGTVDDDLNEENYGAVAAELRKIQESFPKDLATEINEFNSKITPFSAGVCGRSKHVNGANEEIEKLRQMFPNSKLSPLQTGNQSEQAEVATVTFFTWLLSLIGLA